MAKQEMIFTSRTSNLNIIKHKGATVVTATPGGMTSTQTPTSWIKIRKHRLVTSDPEEIEITRQHIIDNPNDGIRELIKKTPEDILKEENAKLTEQIKRVQMAKELTRKKEKAIPDSTATVTQEEEKKEEVYTCKKCGKKFTDKSEWMHHYRWDHRVPKKDKVYVRSKSYSKR